MSIAIGCIAALFLSQGESAATTPPTTAPTAPAIAVSVDPRLELLSIVFRLAGNPEYDDPSSRSPYASSVAEKFGPFADHPAIARAKELRAKHGVSYDAVASLAMHVDPATLVLADAGSLGRLEARWTPERAADFLVLVHDFRSKTGFDDFYASNAALYRETERRMNALVERKLRADWFARYFGSQADASFALHPGLLIGGNNFGVGVRHASGREDITPCIGCWKFDSGGVPVFEDSILWVVVHEFCHSYANPIVDRHFAKLSAAGDDIFPRVETAMKAQAYVNWKIVLYESLVRAAVIRYLSEFEGESAASRQAKHDQDAAFAWAGDLAALLAEYEADRESWPSLDDFAPRIVDFFDSLAQRMAESATNAPRVRAMTPANGATGVSPALTEIVIEFDRPMRKDSYSVTGGGDPFPVVPAGKKPAFDAGGTVFTIPVRLEPSHVYRFGLNSARHRSFASVDGVPLDPIVVTFETGKAPETGGD